MKMTSERQGSQNVQHGGTPWRSSGYDSAFSLLGAQVQCLGRGRGEKGRDKILQASRKKKKKNCPAQEETENKSRQDRTLDSERLFQSQQTSAREKLGVGRAITMVKKQHSVPATACKDTSRQQACPRCPRHCPQFSHKLKLPCPRGA